MNVYQVKPRRTRLRLGRGGAAYLLVTAVILGAAVYTQANLLFWSFGLMVGGLIASIAIGVLSLRKMTLQRLLPPHAVTGEPLVLRYQVANGGRMPAFAVTVRETWGAGRRGWRRTGAVAEGRLGGRPLGWLLHVGPGQTLQAEASCTPRRRGDLAFERIVLESGFPFGVIQKRVEFDAPASVLIYPRLYRINRRLLQILSRSDAAGVRQTDRSGGREDFFGLRPYRAGDSVKLIDWKHSISSGDIVVRELTRPSLPRIMVLLDLRRAAGDKPTGSESAISLTASLILDAYLNGCEVGLEVAGSSRDRFGAHHSLPHRKRMLDALARLDPAALRDGEPVTERPSVIVVPGRGSPLPMRRAAITRPLTLGGEDLDQHVRHSGESASALLMRRPDVTAWPGVRSRMQPISRRMESAGGVSR